MDDEPLYDLFDYDDACFMNFIADVTSTCDTFAAPLDGKSLPDSLKYGFLSLDESSPMIISFNLDQD